MKKKLLSHILMVATILTSYTVGTMQPTQTVNKKDRCNGGHEIWEKTITKSVSIPIHEKEINGGMARRLAKELGLNEV